MADNIHAARRAELEAALSVLEPQIRGLDDLSHVSITSALAAEVSGQSVACKRRRDLIQAELDAMDACDAAYDALLADGYPEMPPDSVVDSVYAELKEQMADLEAAAARFQAEASRVSINLGTPVPKTPAAPSA
jgi:hypothetical protein